MKHTFTPLVQQQRFRVSEGNKLKLNSELQQQSVLSDLGIGPGGGGCVREWSWGWRGGGDGIPVRLLSGDQLLRTAGRALDGMSRGLVLLVRVRSLWTGPGGGTSPAAPVDAVR